MSGQGTGGGGPIIIFHAKKNIQVEIAPDDDLYEALAAKIDAAKRRRKRPPESKKK